MFNVSALFEFPTILIVIGMVLLLAAVVVGIFAYRKPKKDKDDIDIEEKLEQITLEEKLDKIKEITEEKKIEELEPKVEEKAEESAEVPTDKVEETKKEEIEVEILEDKEPVLVEQEEIKNGDDFIELITLEEKKEVKPKEDVETL